MNNPEIMPLKRHGPSLDRSQEYNIEQPDGTILRKKLGEITTDEATQGVLQIGSLAVYRPKYVNNPEHPRDVMRNQMHTFLNEGFTNSVVANHHWDKATDQKTGHIDIDRLHEEALLEDSGRDRITKLLETSAREPELFEYLQKTARELAYDNESYRAMPLNQLERCLDWAKILHQNPQAIRDGITPLQLEQEENYWLPTMERWEEGLTSYPEQVRNFNHKATPADYQMSIRRVVEHCGAEEAIYKLTWDNSLTESRRYTSEEVTWRFIHEHNDLIQNLDHTPRQVIEHTMQWLTHEETDSEGRVSLGLLRIVQEELEQTRRLLESIKNCTYAEEFSQPEESDE